MTGQNVRLTREVSAIQIPDGIPTRLIEGTEVHVEQELGGMYTVRTLQGFLVRVDGKDADALGRAVPELAKPVLGEGEDVTEEALWDTLRTCFDPEIPVNIVDLGLIYECRFEPREDGAHIYITMTLTAPGCGMGQVIADDVERKITALPGVARAMVELTFDPPWDRSMMSEAARLELGLMW